MRRYGFIFHRCISIIFNIIIKNIVFNNNNGILNLYSYAICKKDVKFCNGTFIQVSKYISYRHLV